MTIRCRTYKGCLCIARNLTNPAWTTRAGIILKFQTLYKKHRLPVSWEVGEQRWIRRQPAPSKQRSYKQRVAVTDRIPRVLVGGMN